MKYICLLRGINVSGQKIIKMEYLREVFLKMGFKEVQTYIQSGNIVIDTINTDETTLISRIEKECELVFGFNVTTFVRNYDEWNQIINNNPFENLHLDSSFKSYVTFFHSEPDLKLQQKLLDYFNEDEKLVFKGREMYSLIKKDLPGKQIFSNNFVESKLKLQATTRNWNTILKLLEYNSPK